MKHCLSFLLCVIFCIYTSAQGLVSPASFLGYEPGTRYTPHHKIVAYFQQAAQAAPGNVVMKKYGETYEGRPLYVAFVSSAENISNLENIRTDNLRRAGLLRDNKAEATNVALVWLSYNVHGNEPSSSEAAMVTLYEILTKHTGDWLKNTVVVMDPCMNPDGRDRYANWFNSVVGAQYNASVYTREHDEPWPGGRVNHYYFDLNRDWAWQTQVESRERAKIYNQWMPHIHVDYHEQGYNEPYYFAPAAEPFHEVITPWQREFQTMIGRNNARYFDRNGWLYFTKERFDLFYPSYGDTWPTYNGAIGMTYEQAGHSAGGLAVLNEDGDTLTLVSRVAHHHTTGLSTIEITSQNASRVIQEFKKFFDDGRNAVGSEYKTYLLTSNDAAKINSLRQLLISNGVGVGSVKSAPAGMAYNYITGKNENLQLEKYTLAVSAFQPRSAMAKVLLEPRGKLSDSATYDITAWSLPYAYGVKAYGSVQRINADGEAGMIGAEKAPATSYGLFVPYTSLQSARLMARLLAGGVRVRMNDRTMEYKGRNYDRGTIILLKKENENKWNFIEEQINAHQTGAVAIETGFMDKGPDMGSPDVKMVHAPKVACLTGDDVSPNATGEVWHLFDRQLPYPVAMLNAADLRISTLNAYNVLILPNGYYRLLGDKGKLEDLKNWVRAGGRIVALENAALQLAGEWGVKMKKPDDEKESDKKNVYEDIKKYENRERDDLVNSIPGAIYRVELDPSHPLAYGYGKEFFTLKQSGDVMEFLKDGWNVGVIKTDAKLSGFAGVKVTKQIKDGTVFAVQDMGRGAVIYLVDNPMFRSFWENGKLLFLNAVFLVGNNPIRL
jgi:uncharacterized membrane protein